MKSKPRTIGIVGGVGPYAGLDLNAKIFKNTVTTGRDQDHLEVYLLSRSCHIPDRTEFLINSALPNPAEGIFETLVQLEKMEIQIAGIPCNTAHSKKIWGPLQKKMVQAHLKIELLHLIEETYYTLQKAYPSLVKLGLLSTKGIYVSGIYPEIFEKQYQILIPSERQQEVVHQAIYHPDYGIKAHANPVSQQAIEALTKVSNDLIANGAEAIIMGCTEIPLALEPKHFSIPLLDPTDMLARALIRRVAPEKLMRYN